MDEKDLRHKILGSKKTERVIFAVTPEMKNAMTTLADDQCITVLALLTKLVAEEIVANKALFAER